MRENRTQDEDEEAQEEADFYEPPIDTPKDRIIFLVTVAATMSLATWLVLHFTK